MMHGRSRKPARLTVEPLHVVTRRSTDIVALGDPVVADAAGYSSESYLTQVFRQELGQTPARYRRQVRAEAGP